VAEAGLPAVDGSSSILAERLPAPTLVDAEADVGEDGRALG
jgi:hypothetical protein